MTITIPVAALLKLAKELDADGMKYVNISISEEEDDGDGDMMPACINFSGIMPDDPSGSIDYDEIEHVAKLDR